MLSEQPISKRNVGILLGLGIFFMPFIFAWFTLRKGHSVLARILAFGWCVLPVFIVLVAGGDKNKRDKQPTNTASASAQASSKDGVDSEVLAQWTAERERETRFCQILERTKKQYKKANELGNSIAKEKAAAEAVQARKNALEGIPESFVGWVAQVKNISASSGTLSLHVSLPCSKTKVELKHRRPSNPDDEAVFASLEKGGWVLVSGSFYPGKRERDRFSELSITESGSMDEPEFEVAFFKVKPIKNKKERYTPEEEAQVRGPALASFHDELLKDITTSNEKNIATENKAHEMLQKMSDQERNATLTVFFKESGEDCDSVTKNFFQGLDESQNAFWNVACQNKKSYAVMINNDSMGSTKILSCAVLKAVNAGECFKKF